MPRPRSRVAFRSPLRIIHPDAGHDVKRSPGRRLCSERAGPSVRNWRRFPRTSARRHRLSKLGSSPDRQLFNHIVAALLLML